MITDGWTQKWWKRAGEHAYVEIQLSVMPHEDPFDKGTGPYRWAVYANISETHPLYAEFDKDSDDIWQRGTRDMPLHSYPSFFATRSYRRPPSKAREWVIVGADYNHLHDERFTHMATPEDATAVFRDAERLAQWLKDAEK